MPPEVNHNSPGDEADVPQDGGDDLDVSLTDDMPQAQRDEFEEFAMSELGFGEPSAVDAEDDNEDESLEDELPGAATPGPEVEPVANETAAQPGSAPVPAPVSSSPQGQVQPRWQVGEEQLTAQEIIERGIFNQVMTYAQRLLLEREQGQPAGQSGQAQGAEPDPDALRKQYEPVLENLIKMQYLDPAEVDTNPGLATGFAYVLDENRRLREDLDRIVSYLAPRAQQEVMNEDRRAVEDAMVQAADGNALYERLKDPEERNRFGKWLAETVNPERGKVTPEFAQRMYIAYNYQTINQLKDAETKANGKRRAKSPEAAMASAENGSARARGGNGVATDPQQAEIDEFLSEFKPGWG